MLEMLRSVHMVSAWLFAGAILVLLVLQSLVFRAQEDAERKVLARTTARVGRLVIMPVMYVAYLSGLAYFLHGLQAFKSAPWVHTMMLLATLAVGMAEVSRGKIRRLSAALEAGQPFAGLKPQLVKGWIFALLSFVLLVGTLVVAVMKVPRPHA